MMLVSVLIIISGGKVVEVWTTKNLPKNVQKIEINQDQDHVQGNNLFQ